MSDLVTLKIPVELLDSLKEMSVRYNLNPISILQAALNEYDRNWNNVFETRF